MATGPNRSGGEPVSDTTYRQCTLQRQSAPGYENVRHKIAWIPSRFAVVDKVLKIAGVDGWKVIEVGQKKMSQEFVMQRRDDYRYQRRVSDA